MTYIVPANGIFNGRYGSVGYYSSDLVKMRKWQIRTDTSFVDAGLDNAKNLGNILNPLYPPLAAKRFMPESYCWDANIEGFMARGVDEVTMNGIDPMLTMMKMAGIAIIRSVEEQADSIEVLTQKAFLDINKVVTNPVTHLKTITTPVYAKFVLDDKHYYWGSVFVQNFEIMAEFPKSLLVSVTLKGTGVLEYHIYNS